jgi:hypothetical protein
MGIWMGIWKYMDGNGIYKSHLEFHPYTVVGISGSFNVNFIEGYTGT